MTEIAIGIIDAQAGFMPAEEGLRCNRHGFGELPVTDGEQIIAPINALLGYAALHRFNIFTTQDWHPYETAHFSDDPNYVTNWPRHCVEGTPGAELHPSIIVPGPHTRFTKGSEILEAGEDDLSYSGFYAEDPTTGHSLPEWLAGRHTKTVILGGLALDYCVGKTALDLRTKLGLEVIIAIDATRAISAKGAAAMQQQFDEVGVRTMDTADWLQQEAA